MTSVHRSCLLLFGLSVGVCTTSAHAQSGEINLKATSANVKESGSPVRVHIVRWSTDEERNPVVAALTPAAPNAAAGTPAAPNRATAPSPPAGAGPNPPAAAGRGAAGRGRGVAGRGGRGDAAPLNPIAALTAAIAKEPTLGYVWTTEVTGYAIKYAYHASLPDGGERIVLATDRRLGAYTPGWKPLVAPTPAGADASATPALTDYEFTVIELRLDSKGSGEGKTSLTTKVIVDDVPGAKTVALDNYAATPAIFLNVKRQ